MAFAGKYYISNNKATGETMQVPLYYLESDVAPYCDKALLVSAPGANMGHLYVGAKDIAATDADNGIVSIEKQASDLVHNFSGTSVDTIVYSIPIKGGSYGTKVRSFSVTGNYDCSYGAKSDGWCGTRFYLRLDDTNLNTPPHITKSWGGNNKTLTVSASNITVPAGDHTLKFVVATHASSGDGAYFKLNWYSLNCQPLKKFQVLSNMHFYEASSDKEYVLCKSFSVN